MGLWASWVPWRVFTMAGEQTLRTLGGGQTPFPPRTKLWPDLMQWGHIFHVPSLFHFQALQHAVPGTGMPFLLAVTISYSFFKSSLGICPSRKPNSLHFAPSQCSSVSCCYLFTYPLPLVEMRQPEGTRQCFVRLHMHSTLVRLLNDVSKSVEYSWATTGLKATQGNGYKISHFILGYLASPLYTGKSEWRADLAQWLASPLVWIANSAICSTIASPLTSPNQPTSLPSSSLRVDQPASH